MIENFIYLENEMGWFDKNPEIFKPDTPNPEPLSKTKKIILAGSFFFLGILYYAKKEYNRRKAAENLEQFKCQIKRQFVQEEKFNEQMIPQDESTLDKTVPEIINLYENFECQVHKVMTADGYQLELHRILVKNGRKHLPSKQKQSYPVILQHGILADSSNWVLNGGDEKSLAFALSSRGHDVWLSNSRGNKYSKSHERYGSELDEFLDENFWDFTWYEMAKHDVPAVVQHVTKITKLQKVHYIGHSQGTLTMFTALHENNFNIQSKIASFHALCPIAFLENAKAPYRFIANHMPDKIIYQNWKHELLADNVLGKFAKSYIARLVSNKTSGKKTIAGLTSQLSSIPYFLSLFIGFNPHKYCQDKISTIMNHSPSGTSFQNVLHFAQMMREGKLQTFKTNATSQAYEISLENIKESEIYLYVGNEDIFSDGKDVDRLEMILKQEEKGNKVVRMNLEDYDHLSFLYGRDAYFHVYQHIIERIESSLLNRLPDCVQS